MKVRLRNLVILRFVVVNMMAMILIGSSQVDTPSGEAEQWAEKTLAGLTLGQKAGQMICAEISGGYIAESDPRLKQWISLARDSGVGMFVLYGGTPRERGKETGHGLGAQPARVQGNPDHGRSLV